MTNSILLFLPLYYSAFYFKQFNLLPGAITTYGLMKSGKEFTNDMKKC